MEMVARALILGIAASVMALVLKKNAPEFSLVLGIIVSALLLFFAISLFGTIFGFIESLRDAVGLHPGLLTPVLRTVGIGILTKLGADLCRDAGQGSIASTIEFVGTVACVYIALPLMQAVFEMIGGLL